MDCRRSSPSDRSTPWPGGVLYFELGFWGLRFEDLGFMLRVQGLRVYGLVKFGFRISLFVI